MGFLVIPWSSVVGPVLHLVNEATLPEALCAMGPLGTSLSQLWESLIWFWCLVNEPLFFSWPSPNSSFFTRIIWVAAMYWRDGLIRRVDLMMSYRSSCGTILYCYSSQKAEDRREKLMTSWLLPFFSCELKNLLGCEVLWWDKTDVFLCTRSIFNTCQRTIHHSAVGLCLILRGGWYWSCWWYTAACGLAEWTISRCFFKTLVLFWWLMFLGMKHHVCRSLFWALLLGFPGAGWVCGCCFGKVVSAVMEVQQGFGVCDTWLCSQVTAVSLFCKTLPC